MLAQRSPAGPFAARVRDEQIAMLYARNRVPTLVGVPFGALVCAFGWPEGPHAGLVAWFALKVLTATARLGTDAVYTRYRERASADTWRNRYAIALALDGLVWSLLILFFAGPERGELGPVGIAAVLGVGSSGLFALSTDRLANTVFATALLVPGAARLLLLDTRLGAFGGAALLVFLFLVVEHGMRVSEESAELLRLRFEVAHARDAALAAGTAKGDFLATMSHELRTPLNAVIGMAGLLADTEMTPDQRERLDVIRASGETLLTLIGDILDVSKIEAGKLEIEAAPLELVRVVEDSLNQAAPAAFSKGLELGYAMTDECPAALVSDAMRVRQILANLLGNAIKFTAKGHVTVQVSHAALDGERVEIAFEVRDTGVGIEPENLARLFVPFTQADATTTRRYGGTGLGLAICKSLTELLGGVISAESALGEGSIFRFSIVGKALPTPRLRALPINAGSRVCVLSDQPTSRGLLEAHVNGFGFVASRVASVAAAIELVVADGLDLVVFDARRNVGATHAVRALREARETLPIVALVSPREASPFHDDDPPAARVATVSMPVKTGRLLEVVEALLAGQPAPLRTSAIADLEPRRPPDPARGSVLVVDDNELNRRVAVEMVRRLGLSTCAVGSGAEAIDAFRVERFDHVLMDVHMPVMDGFEATRRILELAREAREEAAHHRDDRERLARGSRALPRGRDERIHHEARPPERAGRRAPRKLRRRPRRRGALGHHRRPRRAGARGPAHARGDLGRDPPRRSGGDVPGRRPGPYPGHARRRPRRRRRSHPQPRPPFAGERWGDRCQPRLRHRDGDRDERAQPPFGGDGVPHRRARQGVRPRDRRVRARPRADPRGALSEELHPIAPFTRAADRTGPRAGPANLPTPSFRAARSAAKNPGRRVPTGGGRAKASSRTTRSAWIPRPQRPRNDCVGWCARPGVRGRFPFRAGGIVSKAHSCRS